MATDRFFGIMRYAVTISLNKDAMPMTNRPTFSIPLDLPDVRIVSTTTLSTHELIIDVESTLQTTTCRTCGREIQTTIGHDRPLKLRHLPILGMVVSIHIRPKRFRCPYCADHPTTTQQLAWYRPKALHTIPYEQHLLVQLINSTIEDVCQKEDTSYDAVLSVLDAWVTPTVDWATVPRFTVLGIDAIALKKGHRNFVVIVTARTDDGRITVVAVLADRTKTTLVDWLRAIPVVIRCRVQTVCTDMWDGYVRAVAEVLPHARIVIDRFHVACH